MAEGTGIVECLEAGLRAASLRQGLIAHNIANLATPGYRRHDAAFDQVLAQAIQAGRPVTAEALLERIRQPRTTPVDSTGNDVELDAEVGELVQNSLRYKTYMRLLANLYRRMELAIEAR